MESKCLLLLDAVWNGDSERITKEMNALLRRTISYHDYREDFYHAFLAGIFTGAGYMVDSNKKHGEGRSDVVIYDSMNARVAIFEAKYTKVLENLGSACDTALRQIDDRMYAKEYEEDYDQILCYGISFFKKALHGKEKVTHCANKKPKPQKNSGTCCRKTVHGGRTEKNRDELQDH
ncbi:MAG: PD-(D/E)XK nuclease domain-containing protein [Roseburia sp.]